MNPLQYVLSFNPPLILTNFSMAPLEVFEIDIVTEDDETKSEEKNIGKIAPETSKYIVELDMTENNQSEIKFVFHDTVRDRQLTCKLEKFNFPE